MNKRLRDISAHISDKELKIIINNIIANDQKIMFWRIIYCISLLLWIHVAQVDGAFALFLYLCAYLIIGYDILEEAFLGIIHREMFDEHLLMAIATLGAFGLALYTKSSDYLEGILVMLLFQIGELFEDVAVDRSKKNISELIDIRPDYANLLTANGAKKVNPEEVHVGDSIIVNPGEKVPLDGIVLSGSSTLNVSSLTGESSPQIIGIGDDVYSGCINLSGVIRVKITKEFQESTASKILDLVENAADKKAKSEDFITKFARVYTPIVCLLAFCIALLPPTLQAAWGEVPTWSIWIYRALTFLVVSCPCALVISIPLTFFAGIGGASRTGILIKGANFLEALSKINCITFDKTGTLTKGSFTVTGIHHSKLENEKLLEYAALAECASSHPISKSLQVAYGKEIDHNRVSNIHEIAGNGVIATVDGKQVAVGNTRLMDSLYVRYHECHSIGTILHIAIDGKYAGHIVISDVIKENSKETIVKLHKLGVSKAILVTGDIDSVASHVAKELDLDSYYSNCLPERKVSIIEELITNNKTNGTIAFVGDGINDAPVLTRADVGVAMGAMGSDAAIESADVVLMNDDPLQIPKAIKISRKCMHIVKENIIFALSVKFICLILSAFGIANMWMAIFADVGVMILAVLNAIRALHAKNL